MKTSKLTGPALDWAVAKCEGVVPSDAFAIYTWQPPRYSTDWAQGGPIIERERIGPDEALETFGLEFLAAALRTYVAAKLGEEVDIPDELKD